MPAAWCRRRGAGRVEFVAQVAERVGLAVGVRGEGRADRGEQVRPVQPHRLEFGPHPPEVGEHGGQVGERGVHEPPDARQRRRDGREPGDDVARDVVAGRDLLRRCRRSSRALRLLVGDGLGERPAASRAKSGDRSIPVNRRPSWIAASPVVPLPANGSRTVPPGLHPAAMHRSGQVDRVGGEVRPACRGGWGSTTRRRGCARWGARGGGRRPP